MAEFTERTWATTFDVEAMLTAASAAPATRRGMVGALCEISRTTLATALAEHPSARDHADSLEHALDAAEAWVRDPAAGTARVGMALHFAYATKWAIYVTHTLGALLSRDAAACRAAASDAVYVATVVFARDVGVWTRQSPLREALRSWLEVAIAAEVTRHFADIIRKHVPWAALRAAVARS